MGYKIFYTHYCYIGGINAAIISRLFGGKSYYQGPRFDETINISGTYYVYYWDPYQKGGDYVAVLGYKEQFPPLDFLRALINTPLIRHDYELHLPER